MILTNNQHTNEEKEEDDMMKPQMSILPKPVRMFSYLFFGIVLVVGVCAWMMTQH